MNAARGKKIRSVLRGCEELTVYRERARVLAINVSVSRRHVVKDERLLTNEIFRLILMSTPPGVGGPGYNSDISMHQDKVR